jgi:ribose transport system permease protein
MSRNGTELTANTLSNNKFLLKIYNSPSFGIFIILIVLAGVLSLATNKFLTSDNLFSVFRAFSFTAMMAIGECLVIITGGIDLSTGSVFAFGGVICAFAMTKWGLGVSTGLIMGLASGILFGAMNGVFITKFKLPPFISTLGTMSIARGLSYAITGGFPLPNLPESFKYMGQGYVGPIPVPVILLVIFGIIFSIFLDSTIIGRRVYATGGNEEAAIVSGINTKKIKLIVYSLSGLMASFAGMATAARLGVAQSTAGTGYEMDAIASVIIGGASVSGGAGTILGTIIGAAIMGILRNGLVLLNVSAYWQQTVMGCVIILAVTLDQLRKK